MRVLVVTVVHTPLDARIHRRQATALLDAGHDVIYAAPFRAYDVSVDRVDPRVTVVDLPRATRWRRLSALLAVRRLLRRWAGQADVAILHDPELLLAAIAATRPLPLVWDVHEDLSSSFGDKPWVPAPLGRLLAAVVRRLEWWGERYATLLLAEHGYAERFRGVHTVVPNLPPLPASPRGPVEERVVYLGRVSRLRGAHELAAVGARLAPRGIVVDVIGPVDDDVAPVLDRAVRAGHLRVHGFVPNDEALQLADGALAGLSLLHDHPNYRHSLPTKVVEYQALGIPVVTTPLPAAQAVVAAAGSGVVVPFGDVDAVVGAILDLRRDPARAVAMGRAGRADAEAGRSWEAVAAAFVAAVEAAARP